MLTYILIAVVVVLGFFAVSAMSGQTISGADAKLLVEGGALLVDVRSPPEFLDGHIPGAINIPVQDVPNRLVDFGEKNQTVVLYCRSGARSGRAKRLLERSGFADVKNLGPMSRWS